MFLNRYSLARAQMAGGYTTPLVIPPFMTRSQNRSVGASFGGADILTPQSRNVDCSGTQNNVASQRRICVTHLGCSILSTSIADRLFR